MASVRRASKPALVPEMVHGANSGTSNAFNRAFTSPAQTAQMAPRERNPGVGISLLRAGLLVGVGVVFGGEGC